MVLRLRVVNGYTVDCKMKEFRKVTKTSRGPKLKTVRFDSPRGERLMERIGYKKMLRICDSLV